MCLYIIQSKLVSLVANMMELQVMTISSIDDVNVLTKNYVTPKKL